MFEKSAIESRRRASVTLYPGLVKIAVGEFGAYKKRASLLLRLRIGGIATKKVFKLPVVAARREWAFGSTEPMGILVER